MKSYVAFNLLHRLVDVPIQHRHRAELLQVRQRLRAVLRSPAPIRIYRPQRDMREHHDGRAVLQMLHIAFQPLELLVAQRAQPAGLQVQYVHKSDEVHASLVKTVPACAPAPFSVAFEELFPIVVQHIVLTRHIEHIFGLRALQDLIDRIEFFRFGKMADVAGVQHEFRCRRQSIDFVHRGLQRAGHVGIGGLIESHVAVADLYEAQLAGELSFVQISDSHMGFNKPANPDVAGTLKAAVDKINALPAAPEFMLHTGDISHLSKPEEFDTVDQILKSAKPRDVFYVPGEHDVLNDDGKQFLERYGKGSRGAGWYSFDKI